MNAMSAVWRRVCPDAESGESPGSGFRGKPGALRAGFDRDRQRYPHGWLARIPTLAEQRLQTRGHVSQRQEEDPSAADATGSPRDLPAETLADRNPSGSGQSKAPGLLSG